MKMRKCGLTCNASGFQRMFFSSAGAELSVLCGRFLRVSDTTPLSARSRPTRLRSCQPTCWSQRGQRLRRDNLQGCQRAEHRPARQAAAFNTIYHNAAEGKTHDSLMIDLNDFVTGVDLPAAISRRLKVGAEGKGRI